uniref:Protein V2 n=1 Tax=Clerodendron yellow mosaic virus TaxID=326811 RepID=A0A088DHW0_9GEMI|nr:pre-coat protein [Clerodendron yellow mosaic virus]
MWDPIVNDLPETVHGFRSMLAIKYLQAVENTYSPDTLGYDLVRDLISVLRARNYVEATRRYHNFHARFLVRDRRPIEKPICQPCHCPHCGRHKKTGLGQQAHEQEAQMVSNLQKPRCA